MMKVVVPYTELNPAQAQALRMDGWKPEYHDVGATPYRYFEFLADLWRRGEDFILIEHDIIPWAGALSTFEACDDIWCSFGYPYPPDGYIMFAHGCIRFRAELMQAIPDLFDIVLANDGRFFKVKDTDTRHWKDLDGCVSAILSRTLDRNVHKHFPPVVHTKVVEI